jgi:hypothetical protein
MNHTLSIWATICEEEHEPPPPTQTLVLLLFLSFMDAYSSYNQIPMHEGDRDKTAFMGILPTTNIATGPVLQLQSLMV